MLYGALVRAVKRESAQAVAYWWGVTPQTVTIWRKALGIEQNNTGTLRLRRDYFHEPWAEKAREKAHAKNGDPIRRAKISAAKRGKPMPEHVRAKLLASHLGKKASAETRRKLSEAQKRRGWLPNGRAWTPDEDKLLGQDTDRAIAARLGRSWQSVCCRRERLGIASWRLGSARSKARSSAPVGLTSPAS